MTAVRKSEIPPLADISRPFLAFAADQATADVIAACANAKALGADNVVIGTVEDAMAGLADIRTPSLLVIDLGDTSDVMAEAERLSQVCDPEARVILLGDVNDMLLQRDLIAAGVGDYIVKPFDADVLARAMERLSPMPQPKAATRAPEAAAPCASIAVIGVRGGVGASTFAANMAWFAGTGMDKRVTLVDMDLTFGTQALNMDIDPGNGLGDAMLEPGRMDELFVKRASVTLSERLRVMAAETDTARGDIASAEAFAGLYEILRDDNDVVIVDLPRMLCVAQPQILANFKTIVLLSEPNLAAMRDSARLSGMIAIRAPEAKVSVVLGRRGLAPKSELSVNAFEDGAGLKIAATLPFDPATALAAEAAGKCVVQHAPRGKLSRAITAVSATLLGGDKPKARTDIGALLGRLKRRGKAAEAVDDVR